MIFLVMLFSEYSSKIKFKPRQRCLTVGMLLTSSVSSTTSKQCFEQPAASFLVCSLIFEEYKPSDWIQKKGPTRCLLVLVGPFLYSFK